MFRTMRSPTVPLTVSRCRWSLSDGPLSARTSKLSCGVLKNALPESSIALDRVYDVRSVPHTSLRAVADKVSALNQESPIDSYRLMFAYRGSGRPRLGTPRAAACVAVRV